MGGTSPAKKEAVSELKKVKDATVHRVSAEDMAKKQREISVSEFFAKNRHLLGFDSPRKALLTAVKEAVDNSLDACEEARILPEIEVKIEVAGGLKAPEPPKAVPKAEPGQPAEPPKGPSVAQAERFIVTVTDNGPGIVPEQIGRIFAKLLYGSKFHRLRMSRGQQGIGISAAGLYGQLTTGKPVRVTSRFNEKKPARYVEITIDTAKNEPRVLANREATDWTAAHTGTRVAIELEGRYQKGRTSVDEFLEQTSVANPHARIIYVNPEGQKTVFERMVAELPAAPREIKPHPYGIELGVLMKMLQDTKSHWVGGFLSSDFSRVSPATAAEICRKAGIDPKMLVRKIHGDTAEKLYKAIQQTPLMNPPTDCLSPIGEKAILAGLYKQIKGDFYTAVSRKPAVYRGNPFAIEVGLAFGTGQAGMVESVMAQEDAVPMAEGEEDEREGEVQMARVMRFANRVPLLYQPGACAITKSVIETSWRNYGLSQSRGALPTGPLVIFVHMASVWVPFTSESKEAVADYDEIRKEIRLAMNEAGRRLSSFVRKRERAALELKRRDVFEAYIEEVADACKRLKKGKLDAEDLKKRLSKIAKDITGGDKTDEILKKKGQEEEPAGESTIIVTPEGVVGEVPQAPAAEAAHQAAPTAAEVAKEDMGAAQAAEKARAKAEKKKEPKEKGHGKGKR
ncbi:MAG TPA: DNA topoisomerase VI subunit B [Planctomycetota bacterium]|nr:DNA topoisomerase VI subunit B [Planctomycetota bacterium]